MTQPQQSPSERAREVLVTAQADCGCRIPSPYDEVAEHAIELAFASAQPAEADGVERVCLDQNAVVGSLSFFLEEIDTRGLVEGEWVAKRLSRMIEEMGGFHWGAPGAMPSPEFAATLPAPNDDLRAVLEPFGRYARALLSRRDGAEIDPVPDDRLVFGIDGQHITIGDLRRVAALTQENRRG